MTQIDYQRQSTPRGTAVIDTSRLLIGTDGKVWIHASYGDRLVPADDEQVARIAEYFGADFRDALKAVEALS